MTERLLAGTDATAPMRIGRHLAVHGPRPQPGAALTDMVARAGLRGRGGAGFPAARKLAAVAAGRRPVVVVNGTEAEPVSAKDLLLLTAVPHLVLDGAVLAAEAVGASEIVVVAPWPAHSALTAAVGERDDRPSVTIARSAPGYVAGEETAVLAHLEGRPPRPRLTPPRPSERGLRRRPTLVQNVETLAHMALIARHGPEWFRTAGTRERPGTMLVTISGAVAEAGVREVEPGDLLDDVVAPSEPLRALLVGGCAGGWVEPEPGARLDDAWLAARGATVGPGAIVALGRSSCPVRELARLLSWLAAESAGQCGPCVHGLGALAGAVERLADGRGEREDLRRLERWSGMAAGRGACAHPDGTVRMLASARRVFAAELHDHAHHGPCAACRAPAAIPLAAEAA